MRNGDPIDQGGSVETPAGTRPDGRAPRKQESLCRDHRGRHFATRGLRPSRQGGAYPGDTPIAQTRRKRGRICSARAFSSPARDRTSQGRVSRQRRGRIHGASCTQNVVHLQHANTSKHGTTFRESLGLKVGSLGHSSGPFRFLGALAHKNEKLRSSPDRSSGGFAQFELPFTSPAG
jgi:hypothetical protein